MGMAASQVRFLSLQNRKNTIGLNLMTLSNRKSALSRDMNRVAAQYNAAMNEKNLKWSTDSGVTYNDLSYDLLMKPNQLNSGLPYIVTDSKGRVVVDDSVIKLDGLENPRNVTYRDLATIISAYSGTDNGTPVYNNSVIGVTGSAVTRTEDGLIVNSAGTEGKPSEHGYKIVSTLEGYDFENSMRYDLLHELGLVSKEDQNVFNKTITDLYGSKEAMDSDDYSKILKAFDTNKTEAVSEYNVGEYSDIFGTLILDHTSNTLKFDDTGCAMGNLALAKAYQKEYQAYLNTPIAHDILVNKTFDLGSEESGNIAQGDSNSVTRSDKFSYNESANSGISNRIVNLLTQSGEVTKTGNSYALNVGGILNNLNFYNNSGGLSNYADTIGKEFHSGHQIDYGTDGSAKPSRQDTPWNSDPTGQNALIGTWGNLYDLDLMHDGSTSGSYDLDDDGYINGSDYIDKDNKYKFNTSNKTSGVILQCTQHQLDHGNAGIGRFQDRGFTDFVDFLASSFKQIPDINHNGVEYAKRETKELYADGTVQRDGDGSTNVSKAERRNLDDAIGIFGFGWCDHNGSNHDPSSLSATNVINAFITFYEMYMAVNGDESKIKKTTGDKVWNDNVNTLYSSYYDLDTANQLKNGNGVMLSQLSAWASGKTFNDEKSTTPTVDGTQTATYYYTETEEVTDEDGTTRQETSYYQAIVTGTWNTSTNSFTKIDSITYKESDDETNYYETNVLSYTEDVTTGKRILTNDYYDLTFDNTTEDPVLNGSTKSTTTTYQYSGSTVIGTVELVNPTNNIKKVTIKDDGAIEHVYNSAGSIIDNTSDAKITSNAYCIVDENGAKDPDYKYFINTKKVAGSTFASTITLKPENKYGEMINQLVSDCEAKVKSLQEDLKDCYTTFENRGMDYFDAVFKMIANNGWIYDENINRSDRSQQANNQYINAMFENNMYYITEVGTLDGTDFNYATKLAHNVSHVFQVLDTDAQNAALSKYESEKTEITAKEKQLDIRINKLQTEQDAISTELQSLKKIIDDNVSNTFKIFS